MEFPRMLYRVGQMVALESGWYDYRIVSEDEFEVATAEGWHLDQYAARAAEEKPSEEAQQDGPPTRKELEQKATELGLKFDGRTTDRKLLFLIQEAQ